MDESTIGGYELSDKPAVSKRFRAFRASRRTPEGVRRGTLYLMTEEVRQPDLFIETVDAIREAWPFGGAAERDVVLPEAQLWTGRPWFFVPERLPVVASVPSLGRAAFASLRAQLRWLEEFQPPGGKRSFAHGDVRKERIALFDEEQPLLIAPGWVAASDYAGGRSLSHVRGDDAWHLGKLWILESDRSFVPEGMEVDPNEAGRRLPLAHLEARGNERAARPAAAARPAPVGGTPAAKPSVTRPAAVKPAAARPTADVPAAARAAAPPPTRPAASTSNGVAHPRPAAAAPPVARPTHAETAPPPRGVNETPPARPRAERPAAAAPAISTPVPSPAAAPPQPIPQPIVAAPAPAVAAAPPAPAAAAPRLSMPPTAQVLTPGTASMHPAPPAEHTAPEYTNPEYTSPEYAPPAAPRSSNKVGAIAMFVVLVAVLVVAVLLFGR
jgi:hypothetical protein